MSVKDDWSALRHLNLTDRVSEAVINLSLELDNASEKDIKDIIFNIQTEVKYPRDTKSSDYFKDISETIINILEGKIK